MKLKLILINMTDIKSYFVNTFVINVLVNCLKFKLILENINCLYYIVL